MTNGRKEYEYWGKVAAGYDASTNYVIGQNARREAGEWLSGQFKATDSVLEIGCGPGRYIQRASELVGPEGRVYAADINGIANEDSTVRSLAYRL